MNELLYSCSSAIDQAETPSCASVYGSRITMMAFSKTAVAAGANVPSASEFNSAYIDGTIVLIKGLTNTVCSFLSETEIEIIHKEWHDKQYRVSGKIRTVSETIARMTEMINAYSELWFYFFTDQNYCFGPYVSFPNFTLIQLEGKSVPPHIRFNIDYFANGINYANYDASYETLPAEVVYLLDEEDRRLVTEDGKYIIL